MPKSDTKMIDCGTTKEEVSLLENTISLIKARWPVFLNPPEAYKTGFVKLTLPDDIDQLDPEDQAIARYKWNQATNSKTHEVGSFLNNRVAYNATKVPSVFRELFVRCGEVSEVGGVPLRACLIENFSSWQALGLPGACPFLFQEDEIKAHELAFTEYQEWYKANDFAKEYLDTDEDGWIAPEADFAEKCARNKELLGLFLPRMTVDRSPEEAAGCGHS
ncbi:MAG: hypothetical protein M1818_007766 [Claussenomyces sp. TS43310]|nr:MAG: hypothetical protein M1818_007766 [Claussenomyces sp. TS43310]